MNDIKIPPHSIESEQSVLGAILMTNEAFEKVSDIITHEHFYSRQNSLIYKSMVEMFNKSLPVDIITLSDYLESKNLLDEVGGFIYLGDLQKNTPSASNCAAYAEVVAERYISRGLIAAAYTVSDACYNPSGKTSKDLIILTENAITQVISGARNQNQDDSLSDAGNQFLTKFQMAMDSKGLTGVSTGLTDLDKKTGGLQKSDLIILAARPAMGKTTLALNIANHASKQGSKVKVFSLEMPKDQLFTKLIAEDKRIPVNVLRNPNDKENPMTEEQHTNMTVFFGQEGESGRVLEIDDRGGLTPGDIRVSLKRFIRKHGCVDLVVVDYIQIMRTSNTGNRNNDISEISGALKEIAKEFQCPVIALSQLNRGLEQRADKRPINSDLRDSGAIEQDADLILFVYRDEVYDEHSMFKGMAELILGKQRNGPIGTVKAAFHGQYSSFKNLSGREIEDYMRSEKIAEENARKPKKRGIDF